ncbi:hypothetical protein M408DRAFT_117683 [Serendipita vermifera MAFF 305830]|uniref:Uncharacterized protein n=1 Tax=Serendipita vermifera MAFF 305830 TaxID=933852 RepID=A0A0C3ALR8_SERVB|nr:hypothetical protein M408DRAFT_117683 [Serendipita vermifera MAFF 305830]
MPSRQPAETDQSIPPDFTGSSPRKEPRDLHRMKETAHIHHGRPLDKSHSCIYMDPGIREASLPSNAPLCTLILKMNMQIQREHPSTLRRVVDISLRLNWRNRSVSPQMVLYALIEPNHTSYFLSYEQDADFIIQAGRVRLGYQTLST